MSFFGPDPRNVTKIATSAANETMSGPNLNSSWLVAGGLAVASLFLWVANIGHVSGQTLTGGGLLFWVAVIATICATVSAFRGPRHYTKRMVPHAYRFKFDPGWIAIFVGGFIGWAASGGNWVGSLILGLAIFAAALRVLTWIGFRFPLMTWFTIWFFIFLFGIGIRRFFF